MSTYPFDDLQGAGTGSQDLTAGTQYTFNLTNNSGSSYFTMETPRNFDGVTPRNLSGSITSASSGVVFNQSDYIAGFALPTGNNSFVFTPSTNVTGSTLKLRGTGGIYVELSGSGGSVIDTDAQAFLTAAAITDPTIISAIDTLVVQLKADNIWTKMKAIYPFVGGTATTHKWNLKDPADTDAAFRLVFNGGWTHSSTGVLPNGTNAYADTKLNENTELTLNNEHLSIYSRTDVDGLFVDIGIVQGTTVESNIFSKYNNIFYPRIQAVNGGISNTISSLGLFVSNRVSSTQIRAFQNNVLKLINNNVSSKSNRNIHIAAGHTPGYFFYSPRQFAFASVGDGLTDTEASDFYTAVQAFQTSLSRQV
jgi:hypothetical protein